MALLTIPFDSPVGRNDPFANPNQFPSSPINPPVGYQPDPRIPVGAGICPPGTRCIGLNVDTPLGQACLGTCSPYTPPTQQPPAFDPPTPSPDIPPSEPTGPSGVCDLPTRVYCQSACGFTNGGNGGGCGCQKPGSCTLPNGRTGKTNKTRYYRFGDCRRGTSPGVVEPNTVCVKPRRMNPGNVKALRKAISRASAFDRLVKRNRKALRKLASI